MLSINIIFTQDGTTPLFMAAQENNIRVVQMLIEAGAMVDLADEVSCTPQQRLNFPHGQTCDLSLTYPLENRAKCAVVSNIYIALSSTEHVGG